MLKFMEKHFPKELATTSFFVSETLPEKLIECSNIYRINSRRNLLIMFAKMARARRTIWHSFYVQSRKIWILNLMPWVLKRTVWIPWGGDIYDLGWKLNSDQTSSGKRRLRQYKCVVSRFGCVATLIPDDYEQARREFGVTGVHRNIIYPVQERLLDQWNQPPSAVKHGDRELLRIMIGNSASKTNLHEDILRRLAMYSHEKIRVFAPLSYGDMAYAQQVVKIGTKLFGDHFEPMFSFMPQDDYFKFLESIDVAIFNQKRQQALGNIYYVLKAGKHVYLRSDAPMWEYFTNTLSMDISDACEVGDMPFDRFLRQVDAKGNYRKMLALRNPERVIALWRAILAE